MQMKLHTQTLASSRSSINHHHHQWQQQQQDMKLGTPPQSPVTHLGCQLAQLQQLLQAQPLKGPASHACSPPAPSANLHPLHPRSSPPHFSFPPPHQLHQPIAPRLARQCCLRWHLSLLLQPPPATPAPQSGVKSAAAAWWWKWGQGGWRVVGWRKPA